MKTKELENVNNPGPAPDGVLTEKDGPDNGAHYICYGNNKLPSVEQCRAVVNEIDLILAGL